MSNNSKKTKKNRKIIGTKLTDNKGRSPSEKSLKNMKEGKCVFPFIYNENTYTDECFPGKKGDWCATEVNKKGKMKKFAYCVYEEEKNNPKKSSKNNSKPKNNSKSRSKTIKKKKKKSNNVDTSSLDMKKLGIPKTLKVRPKVWELPNRKKFINWFDSTYSTYRAKKGAIKKKGKAFDFFPHQKLIRDYLQYDSPYRGILLYHGLGVGKTCASIAISEGFRHHRDIVVLLNKSLKQNFIGNLMFCGFEYYRTNQHWFFHKFTDKDPMKNHAEDLGLSNKFLNKYNAAMFVDFTKSPNHSELSSRQQQMLEEQVNDMIKSRYTFLHMDGLNKERLEKMVEDRILDGKVLIIDEAHNLSNAMAKDNPGVRGKNLQKLIMNAKNLKCIFLSGTPMINNLFEVSKLFNMLRGYIKTFNFNLKQISSLASDTLYKRIATVLDNHPLVDQYFINKKDNIVKVTRNPSGFISNKEGVINIDKVEIGTKIIPTNIDDEDFVALLIEMFKINGFSSNYSTILNTALPNDEDDFMRLFYDAENNRIKNPELFKSRIMGLVSFYKTQDKSLLPTVRTNEVIKVDMSDYQFMNYAKVRKDEIEQDQNKQKTSSKKKKKKKGRSPSEEAAAAAKEDNLFSAKSSYRAYSRMHCSFVFPEPIPRPYPLELIMEQVGKKMVEGLKKTEARIALIIEEKRLGRNNLVNKFDDAIKETEKSEKEEKKEISIAYEKKKNEALQLLERRSQEFLKMDDPNGLMKYSPKYNKILKKIDELTKDGKNLGTAFVYTEYKTLEGIAVFSIVLKANGYAPFRLGKNANGDWIQEFKSDDEINKPKYAFWGGDETQSDIIRKIYNNDFDDLPKSLTDQFKTMKANNLRGDVIKVLMTTKSGAEGIDLHNVRQVHVVEPYWNPVRIKQVMGRAVRVGSHLQLPEEDRNVDIFFYQSKMTKEQLKTDKTLQTDKDGMSSDEVLYEISQRKLQVMDDLLKLIKESSVDCGLNLEETKGEDDDFTCLSYGTSLTRDNYAYIPNVSEEHVDTEKQRRITKITWSPKKVTIKGKVYALKQTNNKKPLGLLYDYDATLSGRPGNHVGEIKMKGEKKVVEFKKN